jgi:dTDP-4-amino-4,6-dideoxygalactose transaminase
MSELSAIVGKNQLEHLDEFIDKRNHAAMLYETMLSDVEAVTLFKVAPNFRHSYYKYPLKLAEGIDRFKVAALMKDKYAVETGHVYYPPCHMHPYYLEHCRVKKGGLVNAERVLRQVICLPMHAALTDENVKHAAESLVSSIKAVTPAP